MSEITLLSEADLRACVALDLPSIEAIEQAFVLLATAAVAMPANTSTGAPAPSPMAMRPPGATSRSIA